MEKKFRYKYVVNEEKRTVVCLSSFAGHAVRGVARCAPNDEWDVEKGKELATARCAMKIAYKRMQRAETMADCAKQGLEYYTEAYARYQKYELDAVEAFKVATVALKKLEDTI